MNKKYFDTVANVDVSKVDGVQRDPERVKRLIRSYARQQGNQTALDVIKEDIQFFNELAYEDKDYVAYIAYLA